MARARVERGSWGVSGLAILLAEAGDWLGHLVGWTAAGAPSGARVMPVLQE